MSAEQEPADEAPPAARADEGSAPPVPAGDDVRVGPETSDEPEAGSAEPPD
ncbi:hypothetical protein Asp14428_69000 [Actinoplanes sp. NBRC 14428]|uniref:Uncharacterized protein n=1 Tax=Pseudosporangium ferrugineum TaxID=439699 RepID=A0A2T0RQK6_9ACTN|nr:hypothetical protein [Pseudosporangium ferrugineum]PRY23422.1 hypothetical protein CLV70_115155 [Pseudosporangium ferrugineum]BCJ55425.1 hypothetical protein Asp14428_69000 [Actinoplanes sp. NBRC 14428]